MGKQAKVEKEQKKVESINYKLDVDRANAVTMGLNLLIKQTGAENLGVLNVSTTILNEIHKGFNGGTE